jgi:NADH-quinone oxidoreductase subunit A
MPVMPSGYLPIFVFAVVAAIFPAAALLLGRLLRPSAPNVAKLSAYECGIESTHQARGRISVRFFLIAMLFVIFDAETVFLFPWAVRYRQLGWFGIADAGVFLAFLVVGYVWVIRKRVLEWA